MPAGIRLQCLVVPEKMHIRGINDIILRMLVERSERSHYTPHLIYLERKRSRICAYGILIHRIV